MSIKLTYRGETSLPVEIEGLTPDWAWDKPLAEVERFEIFHGNCKLPVAEMFSVSGDAGDKRFDFEGDLSGVHWIGAQMRTGEIHVHGPAGRHLGSEMRGGEIHVEGDASDWIGCEMRGGLIHVRGDVGHQLGAAYRGSAQGMRGGTIVVDGSSGNEIGLSMKDGVIAVCGEAGDMIGFNMTGGTIVVFGNAGIRPGAGMHGGTIAMLGTNPPRLLPSFRFDRRAKPSILDPVLKNLREKSMKVLDTSPLDDANIYIGDLVADGAGEIYLRHVRDSDC